VDAFGTVVIVLAVVAVLVAAASYWGSGRLYGGLGKGGFGIDHDEQRAPVAAPQSVEAQEEIRQMLEAKSAQREARGEAPLDVEAELAELSRAEPTGDPALREEVRQLVIARNERRARQGKEPLDVEAEVDRELRDLRG
jgi:Spy/CpxP family protein refolding chaperone